MIDDQFAMLPRSLLRSDAWRSLGINERRIIDFLLLEHIAHAGKENGRLKAPYEHLEAFGVGARYLADAIRAVEELGIVDCHRSGMRVATTYALTWLPLHDGAHPSNRWRDHRNANLKPLPEPKFRNLPAKGKVALPAKGKADGLICPQKGRQNTSKIYPQKGRSFLESSTTAKPNQAGPCLLRRADEYAQPEPIDDLPVRVVARDR